MDDDSEERGDQIVDKMEANNGVHVTVDYNGDWECKPTPESEISEVKNGRGKQSGATCSDHSSIA